MKFIFQLLNIFLLIFFITSDNNEIEKYLTLTSIDTTKNYDSWSDNVNIDVSCPCRLSYYFCNYRCCCDENCSNNKDDWRKKGICLNEEKENYNSEFYCSHKNPKSVNNFKYNSLKAGITVRDHIFNVMCIYTDNTKDMGEFYEQNEQKSLEEAGNLHDNWKDNFFYEFKTNSNYGKKEDDVVIYKADSNGNCVKNQHVYRFESIETSCYNTSDISSSFVDCDEANTPTERDTLVEVHYIFNYTKNEDNYNILKGCKKLYAQVNSESHQIKFKVKWNNIEADQQTDDNNNENELGYVQGMPVLVNISGIRYENGFYIRGADLKGRCTSETYNPIDSVLSFKTDLIYSCLNEGGSKDDFQILNLVKKSITIGQYSNSNLKDISKWVPLQKKNTQKIESCNDDIYIFLEILTSKKGKKNSQKMYIKSAALNVDCKPSKVTGKKVISLFVKFAEISYKHYENKINGRISSFISLPDSFLNQDHKYIKVNYSLLIIYIIFIILFK